MEFGLCVENGELKIYGAGLLSSAGELRHVIQGIRAGEICIQKFNVEDAYNTECVVTSFQKRYFYTESIEQAKNELRSVVSKRLKNTKIYLISFYHILLFVLYSKSLFTLKRT